MTSMTEHQPARPAESAKKRRSGPRLSLIGLAVCVVLSVVLALVTWASARSASGDPVGVLILLAPVTLAGGIFGLVALIRALVHYGRQHSGGRTLGLLCLSVAILVGGGYVILQATQPLDSDYRQQQAWEEESARVQQQWQARKQYPSCGTVVVTPRLAPTEFGPAEFRCMRRANAAGDPAELQIVLRSEDITWYVRTKPDRTVELFVFHGPRSGQSLLDAGTWRQQTCSVDRVLLQNPKRVCSGISYYGW